VKLSSSVIKASQPNDAVLAWTPQSLTAKGTPTVATAGASAAFQAGLHLNAVAGQLAARKDGPESSTQAGSAKQASIGEWQPAPLIALRAGHASTPGQVRPANLKRSSTSYAYSHDTPVIHDPLVEELAQQAAQDVRREAENQARQMLSEAQRQASDILQQARLQSAQVSAQAQQDGFAAGQSEAERLLRAARSVVDEIYAWRESMLHQSEAAVLTLVGDIARTIFGNGVALQENVLKAAFEQALAEAKNLGDIQIRLHPEDVAVLGMYWKREQTMTNQKIDLVPDLTVRRGGYLVEGQYGQVDARIETQLNMVLEKMNETLASATESNTPVFAPNEAAS